LTKYLIIFINFSITSKELTMAKKPKRLIVNLQCSDCKMLNYTKRISSHDPQRKKLELQKYCSKCRKHTTHKETKIAKAKKK